MQSGAIDDRRELHSAMLNDGLALQLVLVYQVTQKGGYGIKDLGW